MEGKAKGEEGRWEEVGRRGPGRRRGRISVRPSVGREDALGVCVYVCAYMCCVCVCVCVCVWLA